MAVQTTYATSHNAAYAGMLADEQLFNTVSKLNKSTTVTIPYGYGVVTDGDDGAKLPVAASVLKNFVGIAHRELNRAYTAGQTFGAVPQYDFSVITEGVVWVTASVQVAKDDPVYVIVGDGTGTNQGKLTNVIGTGATTAILISNAKWVSSAASGALAKISIGLGG